MPLSPVTKLYAVEDCKISKITADPAGGTTTYGTAIDVPGIKEVGIGGDISSVELRGDNTLLDSNSTFTKGTVSISHAKLSTAVLAVILGGTVTDSGTTPNQTSSYVRSNTESLNYFKIEAKTPAGGADAVTGDVHFILHKCILTSFPDIGLAEEDYKIVSFEATAMPLISNGDWIEIVNNETAVAI